MRSSGLAVSRKDVAWIVWGGLKSVLFVRRRAQTAAFRHAAVEERLQSALFGDAAVSDCAFP